VQTVLAVVCPPLAVLTTGRPAEVITNLGLTALLFVPGVIHALKVVDRHETEQRFARLLRALGPA
jgi:uncharacterized membrane protein YqaE (UPF0057 family)